MAAPLALQHGVQPFLQPVQIQHVGGGVIELGVGVVGRPPVGALLLLGQVDPDQLAAQVLQAVAVGVGAHQLGRHLGAVQRRGLHPQIVAQHGDVEPGEVKQLQHRSIGHQRAQVGRLVGPVGELDQMGVAVAGRQLHQTQAVAAGLQPHGLAVDGHRRPERDAVRQVAMVQMDGQSLPFPSTLVQDRAKTDAMVPRRGLEPPRPYGH